MYRSGQCRYRYGNAKSDGNRLDGAEENSQDSEENGTEGGDMAVALQPGAPKQQLQPEWRSAHESWRCCALCNAATRGVILV